MVTCRFEPGGLDGEGIAYDSLAGQRVGEIKVLRKPFQLAHWPKRKSRSEQNSKAHDEEHAQEAHIHIAPHRLQRADPIPPPASNSRVH